MMIRSVYRLSNTAALLPWLLACTLLTRRTHAWGLASSSSSYLPSTTFLGSAAPSSVPTTTTRTTSHRSSWLSMDLETPITTPRELALLQRYQIPLQNNHENKKLHHQEQILNVPRPRPTSNDKKERHQQQQQQKLHDEIDATAALHGMPWKTSIDPAYHTNRDEENDDHDNNEQLFYMPFWEWQLDFMKKHLTNLRVLPCTSKTTDQDLSHAENTAKLQRLHTLVLQSDEYKYIRLTVLDAGRRTQVFTSVWYPNAAYNLPILGCDLLQFGETRHLGICDFQPIQPAESWHDQLYEHRLRKIREQYPSLQGKMTQRFYHPDACFFSNQMLLGRVNVVVPNKKEGRGKTKTKTLEAANEVPNLATARDVIYRDLFPAYQQYVKAHVDLVQSTESRPERASHVLERHKAYDTYSAERDPAHGLLAASFGRDFANAYVYDILFPLAEREAQGVGDEKEEQ